MATNGKTLRQGKYNRVKRAYPYPTHGEAGCKWVEIRTASGRVMKVPDAPRAS